MENRENIGWDEVLEGGLAPYSELAAPEEDWLGSLNEAQREAVTTTEGYVRVIAGAGTGKTRALAYRFAYLVNVLGILPGHILCATFTNKAASEMRRRIRRLIGDADTGLINTFHGLCVAVLQADGHALQLPKSFSALDNGDIDAMLAIVYEERRLTLRERTYAQARDKIEMLKTRDRTDYFHDLIAMGDDEPKRRYAEAAWIAEGVRALHGAGVAYGDIAVLYRAHYASRAVEEAFIREQIPTPYTPAHRSSPDARSRTRCRTCASSRRKTTWISAAWPTCPSAIWGAGA